MLIDGNRLPNTIRQLRNSFFLPFQSTDQKTNTGFHLNHCFHFDTLIKICPSSKWMHTQTNTNIQIFLDCLYSFVSLIKSHCRNRLPVVLWFFFSFTDFAFLRLGTHRILFDFIWFYRKRCLETIFHMWMHMKSYCNELCLIIDLSWQIKLSYSFIEICWILDRFKL